MIRTAFVQLLLAIFCFSSAIAGQAPEPAQRNLTLMDAVRVALEKNPTVEAAAAYTQAVHEGIAEAKAARRGKKGYLERVKKLARMRSCGNWREAE